MTFSVHKQLGFTLIELAVVLLIVGALFAGIIVPFTTQIELRRVSETQKTLDEVREALIGFAAAQGRLPCPAAPGATGVESKVPSGVDTDKRGNCTNFWDGFVPGTTLGIGPIDANGYVLDAWNNRIHYAVANVDRSPAGSLLANNDKDFTGEGSITGSNSEMRNVGMATLAPDLKVCSTATGMTATACAANRSLVDTAVAVIYSTGPNGAHPDTSGTRVDENANPNPNATAPADKVFVSHERAGAGAPNGEFDDIVIWLSPNILYAKMIAAGRLP